MIRNIILIIIVTITSCTSEKLVFKKNTSLKSNVCFWLTESDKYIFFNSTDLLSYKINVANDSVDLLNFNHKYTSILQNRTDTIFMWEIAGEYYFFKDTTKTITFLDSINSGVFSDLLCQLLKDKKACVISKDNSNILIMKNKRKLFCYKYEFIYDPKNLKESIVGREVWRRPTKRCCGF